MIGGTRTAKVLVSDNDVALFPLYRSLAPFEQSCIRFFQLVAILRFAAEILNVPAFQGRQGDLLDFVPAWITLFKISDWAYGD